MRFTCLCAALTSDYSQPNALSKSRPILALLQPFLEHTWGDASAIRYDFEGGVVLGTEACSDRATPLQLAHAIRTVVSLSPPAGALQSAGMMITAIVCHSLDYDSRVMPCSLVLPRTGEVQEAAGHAPFAT